MHSGPKSAKEIRESFLHFFEMRDHHRIASASLVPEADPTLMFVNAGMVPFKRVFLGEEIFPHKRATTSQKCMRVSGKHNDLENVGRTPRHHTFFEMLGNFSFGDYFKIEAIKYAWELVTDVFGIPEDRLVVSVFRDDFEAFRIWENEIGISPDRIYCLDESENFWSMGDTGPCGPCSEIHYDFGSVRGVTDDDPSSDSGRFLEIWNLVFMQFNRDHEGRQTSLPKPCVDTGAGLERLASVLQHVNSNYDTDLFAPILARASEVSGRVLGSSMAHDISLRVIADHARAVTFLIGDGVLIGNEGRGYVLRRILRRAARHGVLLGVERPFLYEITNTVIDEMGEIYPELVERRDYIADRVRQEEKRFLETLSKGLTLLESEISHAKDEGIGELSGGAAFKLYDTYGFPVDLTQDILRDHSMALDVSGFEDAMTTQRDRSRKAWKGSGDIATNEVYRALVLEGESEFIGYEDLSTTTALQVLLWEGRRVKSVEAGESVEIVCSQTPFYPEGGGQVGDRGRIETSGGWVDIDRTSKPVGGLIVHHGSVFGKSISEGDIAKLTVDAQARMATARNHSGTHLLHAGLREVLGKQAMQKGSLVAANRLRFDFTHDAALVDSQIQAIEDRVNKWIQSNKPLVVESMSFRDALALGAIAIFEEKYQDDVRVISFRDASVELCGGTHVKATGEIGLLKIVSEAGVASGVRRIEALTGTDALEYLRDQERQLKDVAHLLRTPVGEVSLRIESLLKERKEQDRELEKLRRGKLSEVSGDILSQVREIGGTQVLTTQVDGLVGKKLREIVDVLRERLGSGLVLVASEQDGQISLALGVTTDLTDRFHAGDLVRAVAGTIGGKGGGRRNFAQASGPDIDRLDEAFAMFNELVAGRVNTL